MDIPTTLANNPGNCCYGLGNELNTDGGSGSYDIGSVDILPYDARREVSHYVISGNRRV
jgi:hypothetical protein